MSGLRYVYAVCRPFEAPLQAELTGVAGTPPKLLHHEGLVAVVGHVPAEDFAETPLRANLENLDWLSATARAHQSVIDALTTVTCPLPLRLATVYLDDSGVRVMMEEGRERFEEILERLDGRVEWGVKVHVEPPEKPAADAAPAQGAASGRDYLRQRLQQRRTQDLTWERAERFAQDLHHELDAHAEAARLHRPQNPELSGAKGRNILNAAYLVHRRRSEEFVERVEGFTGREAGLRVELTGPWAPYSFTDTAGADSAS